MRLAPDLTALWQSLSENGADPDACFPYWATAWVGGQALARYILDHPGEVAGRRVLDFASGSGLCAIGAMKSGAAEVIAADIDPLSQAAIGLNAESNAVDVLLCDRDVLLDEPPDVDVILAGDMCYEREMATRVLPWLRRAHERGIRVLVGDPGREYFPRRTLSRLADYDVATSHEIEGTTRKSAGVYTFPHAPK